MPQRNRRKSSRPPPAGSRSGARATTPPRQQLRYKVVELSTVDEGSIESTVNQYVAGGWTFDGVQFAMRESSKRPSMAFVFFTRTDAVSHEQDEAAARERLHRLASGEEPVSALPDEPVSPAAHSDERTWGAARQRSTDPWVRLAELADEGEEEPG